MRTKRWIALLLAALCLLGHAALGEEGLALGAAIPDIKGKTVDGTETTLSAALTEKPFVLLVVCDPEAEETVALTARLAEWAGEQVQFVLADAPLEGEEGPLAVMADAQGRAVFLRRELFAAEEAEEQLAWRFTVLTPDGEPAPEAVVLLCTDNACMPLRMDETGAALFTGAQAAYHAEILKAPKGFAAPGPEMPLPPLSGEAALILAYDTADVE